MDEPPYDKHRCPTYAICPSCGTEFGYDDDVLSHTELRERWIRAGMDWWSDNTSPPENWDAEDQLREAELI